MPTGETARLMQEDSAFRVVVEGLARVVCEVGRPISEPCRNLASTYLRLQQYSEQAQREAQAMQSSGPKAPDSHRTGSADWLSALRRSTEVAVTQIQSEPSPRPPGER
jgi:hypothetical protein